jgi:hypothetical protein
MIQDRRGLSGTRSGGLGDILDRALGGCGRSGGSFDGLEYLVTQTVFFARFTNTGRGQFAL